MIQINPVEKKSGGGLISKITGGAGSAGGLIGGALGAMVGGPGGAMAGFQAGNAIGGSVGGAAQTAGAMIDPIKVSQSSPLQNATASSPDQNILKMAEAKSALNASGIPENQRVSVNQQLDQALQVAKQRRGLV